MNTTIHSNLSELKEFVKFQAEEDAIMPADERRHQKAVVTEVLEQEDLKPNVRESLLDDYRGQVALLARAH